MTLPDVNSSVLSQMNAFLDWSVIGTYLSIIMGASLFSTVLGLVLWVINRK